jgi:hypothetical protein
MMHGFPLASPEAGVFVRALVRASLCVRMRGCAGAHVLIKRAAPAAVRPLAAAVHTQSFVRRSFIRRRRLLLIRSW